MKNRKQALPALPRTGNLHVIGIEPLITPKALLKRIPAPAAALKTVVKTRNAVRRILAGRDSRLLVVVGPCSIHDPIAAMEYARRLLALARELEDSLLLLMRTYFEKPRTTTGWKGLIYDPHMNSSADIASGLQTARQLLVDINALGLPAATEMLDPIVPQYIADLISWVAIGARTTESQTHRQMASGLSMPVGFKNRTDGNVQIAVDAMIAARSPHTFLGIDENGHIATVRTSGNPEGHLILRGSRGGPNYDAASISDAGQRMVERGLPPAIMIDCSHGNAGKRHEMEETVWKAVLRQRVRGNRAIIGMLVESNLEAGSQTPDPDLSRLRYGVSVTDACVDWPTTERMLRAAARQLRSGQTR